VSDDPSANAARGDRVADSVLRELIEALRQWGSNGQAAAEQVREIADRVQIPVIDALAAMLSLQAGVWQQGVIHARRAADAGLVDSLNSYVGNVFTEPNRIEEGLDLLQIMRDAGWPIDPLAYAANVGLHQPERPELLARLLRLAGYPSLATRREWQAMMDAARGSFDAIKGDTRLVEVERERALESMRADASHIADERDRMHELVAEVADLGNRGAAEHLAKEYAKHAGEEEKTADRYTGWSIVAGVVAVLATGAIAYLAFSHEHGAGAILTKATFALPVIAFVAYLGRLASIHRKQAWRWRHIELQIRTARPFVAPLQEDQRQLMTAALALRFFPGQRADPDTSGSMDSSDPVAALGELLKSTIDSGSGGRANPPSSTTGA
jgi:hypothetical protein